MIMTKSEYQKEPWRESLYDVCASPGVFCKVLFCTECMFGQNAAHVNNVSCWPYCCGYFFLFPLCLCGLIHMPMRAKMRKKYGLQEVPNDCIAAWLLSPLAICQETREILSRERLPSDKVRTGQPTKSINSPTDSELVSTSSTNAS